MWITFRCIYFGLGMSWCDEGMFSSKVSKKYRGDCCWFSPSSQKIALTSAQRWHLSFIIPWLSQSEVFVGQNLIYYSSWHGGWHHGTTSNGIWLLIFFWTWWGIYSLTLQSCVSSSFHDQHSFAEQLLWICDVVCDHVTMECRLFFADTRLSGLNFISPNLLKS